MAKQLKDILAGKKASKVVPGSTGSEPGVDYAPKAPGDQDFVKKHSVEKHEDRVGNGDDIYQATNIKHSLAKPGEERHGHKTPKDKKIYEGKEEAKCNMTEAGTACPVHEMADCSKSKNLREIAKNPYAIGMAAAMKKTGDKPPLKKSTIVKGHEIAKSIAKEEVEQLDEIDWKYVDKHPDVFTRVTHKNKVVGLVAKHKDGSASSHRYKTPKTAEEMKKGGTGFVIMKHKSKEDAVNHMMKKAKEQLGEEVEQVDEVSKDTLQRYMHAAKPERMDPEKGKQRRAGMNLALKKVLGGDALGNKPKVKAAGQSKKEIGEEVEQVDEAVRSSNEYRGYHGQAYQQHQGKDNANELAHKAFSGAHSKVKKHAGEAGLLRDVKKPNVMIKHYLDSQHGRHLHGNEGNAAYVKKDFAKFKSKYDPDYFKEEVEQIDEADQGFNKNSKAHQVARKTVQDMTPKRSAITKKLDKQAGTTAKTYAKATYHSDGSATIHTTGHEDGLSSARVVDYHHDINKLGHNRPESDYNKRTQKDSHGLTHTTKKTASGHTIHIKEDLAVPLLGGDDESAEMAKTQLRALANKALHLAMQLSDDQVVEPWVQSKIAVAKDHVTAVHDYMVYGNKKTEKEQTAPYEGGIDMSSGTVTNTFPNFSVDVNTGRNV